MKKIFFSLLLTTITLSSQLNAMWLSLARTAARNMSRRSISAFNHLMAARPLTTHSGFSGSRALTAPQTSLLTRPVESQRSLLQNPTFRSHWEQWRYHSNSAEAQRLFENSSQASSWSKWILGIGAATAALYYDIFSGDENDKFARSLRLTNFDLANQDEVCVADSVLIMHKLLNLENISNYQKLTTLIKNPHQANKIMEILASNPDTFKALCESWPHGQGFLKELVDKNPQAALQFASVITQNPDIFKALCTSWQVRDFLNNLVDTNPQAALQFASGISQNTETFKALCESVYGPDFLRNLAANNPQAAQQFVSLITQNTDILKVLCNSSHACGLWFLKDLVDKSPQVAQQFTSAITQNPDIFITLCESLGGKDYLNKLVDNNTQTAQQFFNAITRKPDTFKALYEAPYGPEFLTKLIENNHQVIQEITSIITQNNNATNIIARLCGSWGGSKFLEKLINNNPQAAQQFTSVIIQNPDIIKSLWCDTWHGGEFLRILFKNPKIARQFINTITQNIDTFKSLCCSEFGSACLRQLIDCNPQTSQQFISLLTQNPDTFKSLCGTLTGGGLLKEFLENNPQAGQQLTLLITQEPETIKSLVFSSWLNGSEFFQKLFEHNRQTALQFSTIIIQNPDIFKDLCKSGKDFLNKLVDKNLEAAQQFTNVIIQNPDIFKDLYESSDGLQFLNKLVVINPQTTQLFISIITQNFETLKNICNSLDGANFINKLFATNLKTLINLLIKNLDQSSQILGVLSASNPKFSEMLSKEVQELCKTNDFGNSEKFIKLFQLCMEASSSQTTQHLRHNKDTMSSQTVSHYLMIDRLNSLYHKTLTKEEELQKNGYVTFVHGQRRDYYLPELVYTFLWEIANNKKVDNFVFAHVKQPATNPAHEQATLEQLRKNGRNTHDDRQRLLFLNYAFFGNDSNLGSNTAKYVKANNNVGGIQLSFADIFNYFGFKNIYEHYKNQLEELQQKYKTLSPEGTLLLIGVPKEKVNDVVYLAHTGGSLRSVNIQDIGETNDTQIILETLRNHPERISDTDALEFCMIMTENGGGLDPDTGIQVHPFIPCDNEEELQKLEAERKKLFEQIAQDIRKQRQQQSFWYKLWPF